MRGVVVRAVPAWAGLGLMMLLLGVSACSNKPNPIASNVSYGPDDYYATRILNAADRAKVIQIMKESVDGPANDPARPAKYGVRWDDVTQAADKASAALELAVVSVNVEDDGSLKRIEIVSAGDEPVELLVRRVAPPQVYEATATAGLFGNKQELADRLVSAFHDAMRAFGSKPGWPPLPNN